MLYFVSKNYMISKYKIIQLNKDKKRYVKVAAYLADKKICLLPRKKNRNKSIFLALAINFFANYLI